MTTFYNKLYGNSYYGNFKYNNNTSFYEFYVNDKQINSRRELFKLLKEQKIFNKFCLALANLTQGKYNVSLDENNKKEYFMFAQPKTQLNSFINTIMYQTKYGDLTYVRHMINTPFDLKPKIT